MTSQVLSAACVVLVLFTVKTESGAPFLCAEKPRHGLPLLPITNNDVGDAESAHTVHTVRSSISSSSSVSAVPARSLSLMSSLASA
jgi:hypothetical protein